eukprot:10938134-Lingulodinium_polyedra.AAC.1
MVSRAPDETLGASSPSTDSTILHSPSSKSYLRIPRPGLHFGFAAHRCSRAAGGGRGGSYSFPTEPTATKLS